MEACCMPNDIIAQMQAMLQQAQRYRSGRSHDIQHAAMTRGSQQHAGEEGGAATGLHVETPNRVNLAAWCGRVIDHLELFHQEDEPAMLKADMIATALFYLDGFYSTFAMAGNGELLWNARNLKLVTATSLLLVVKLHSSANDEEKSSSLLKMLPALLDGEHTTSQIVAMELMLLRMLGFQMYPPSAVRFVHEIYRHGLASQTKADALDQHNTMKLVFRRAMELAEVSVTDFCVAEARQSIVAQAAILNAIELCLVDSASATHKGKDRSFFLKKLKASMTTLMCSPGRTAQEQATIVEVQNKLWLLWSKNNQRNGEGWELASGDNKKEEQCCSPHSIVEH
jgi:hypothetical protein